MAARALFVRHGFKDASIAAIAQKARVATPTVYASFGSKRGLLMALADQISDEARRLAGAEHVFELTDPREQLLMLARFLRVHGDIGGDVLQMAQSSAVIDREAASVVREREEARRQRSAALARAWEERGLLRPGMDAQTAIDIMWALSDPTLYRLFVRRSGWSGDRFEQWFRESVAAQVLA